MWKYLSRVVVRGEVRSSGEFEFGFGVADCQIFHHWRVIRPCLSYKCDQRSAIKGRVLIG